MEHKLQPLLIGLLLAAAIVTAGVLVGDPGSVAPTAEGMIDYAIGRYAYVLIGGAFALGGGALLQR